MSSEEKQNGLSRRSFIKGAAVSSVMLGSAGALIGCGKDEEAPAPKEASTESATPSFLKKPDPIPNSEIKKTVTADVVV
ncbi:MAG TPA: twin-arginine translocation signal domain-containing protein, partial [Syntrophomonas sp.]|nr:twin-arginine translocation signal domain-containing protein [Syntrophomonas sp.]